MLHEILISSVKTCGVDPFGGWRGKPATKMADRKNRIIIMQSLIFDIII